MGCAAGRFNIVTSVPSTHGFPAPWAGGSVVSTALILAAGHGTERIKIWPLTAESVGTSVTYRILCTYGIPDNHPSNRYCATRKCRLLRLGLADDDERLDCLLSRGRDPVRRSRWLTKRSHSSDATWTALLATAASATIIVVLVAFATPAVKGAGEAPGAPASVRGLRMCLGAQLFERRHGCEIDTTAPSLYPSVDNQATDDGGAYACWIADKARMRTCSYGSTRPNATRIALVGDSHAAMILPAPDPGLARKTGGTTPTLVRGLHMDAGAVCEVLLSAMPAIQMALLRGHYTL